MPAGSPFALRRIVYLSPSLLLCTQKQVHPFLSEFIVRSFSLPSSPPREAPGLPQPAAAAPAPTQPDHPPSYRSAAVKPRSAWQKARAAVNRLRASFARSEAVHQARLDGALSGPERHLLVRYTCSVK